MCTSDAIAKRICLGTAQLGLDYGIANRHRRPDDSACDRLLSHAIERGVVCWDTARNYGDAEVRIGKFLRQCPKRDEVRIVSKLPPPPEDLPAFELTSWVAAETEASVKALGIQQLHGWLVHDCNTIRKYESGLWDALSVQRNRGLVKNLGISVYDEEELRLGFENPDLQAAQLTLNLLDHRFAQSGLLGECQRRNVEVYARSILLQGVFVMAPDDVARRVPRLRQPLNLLHSILSQHNLRPLDVALPFALAHHEVDFAVIGVDDESQLDDNLSRAESSVSVGLVDQLRAAFSELPTAAIEPRQWETF